MDELVSENIFLLEFLVDKCIILPCAIPKDIDEVIGETCISFKFLNNDDLDVCEENASHKHNNETEKGNVKSGKSCVFALSSSQAYDALSEFDITVCVFKKLLLKESEDRVQIGMTFISITDIFGEIIEQVQNNIKEKKIETVCRTIRDNFGITNVQNDIIGSIHVYIRLSCLGKVVITQFQMNLAEKTVVLKDEQGKSTFKYCKKRKRDDDDDETNIQIKTCKPISTQRKHFTTGTQTFNNETRCADCEPPSLVNESFTDQPEELIPKPSDKDVFILRIENKNSKDKNKKPKLELTMVTPKGLPSKIIDAKVDNQTQCENTGGLASLLKSKGTNATGKSNKERKGNKEGKEQKEGKGGKEGKGNVGKTDVKGNKNDKSNKDKEDKGTKEGKNKQNVKINDKGRGEAGDNKRTDNKKEIKGGKENKIKKDGSGDKKGTNAGNIGGSGKGKAPSKDKEKGRNRSIADNEKQQTNRKFQKIILPSFITGIMLKDRKAKTESCLDSWNKGMSTLKCAVSCNSKENTVASTWNNQSDTSLTFGKKLICRVRK